MGFPSLFHGPQLENQVKPGLEELLGPRIDRDHDLCALDGHDALARRPLGPARQEATAQDT